MSNRHRGHSIDASRLNNIEIDKQKCIILGHQVTISHCLSGCSKPLITPLMVIDVLIIPRFGITCLIKPEQTLSGGKMLKLILLDLPFM
jgi:hypothetical protein